MVNKTRLTRLSYVALLLLLWFVPTAAYADGGSGLDGGFTVVENTPPAKVSDLAVESRSDTSLTLTWTAPGDDGLSGTASQYDIRYSTSVIDTEAAWEAAAVVSDPPTPQPAASSEAFTVAGLNPGTRYYCALKTADEMPNWSDLSNSPLGITSESAISYSSTYEPEYTYFAGQTSLLDKINPSGVITQSVTADSFDGILTLAIDKGTAALTRNGTPLRWIGIYEVKDVPSPPKTAYVVSLMHELQPAGATFDPPATLSYSYDPGHVPEDADEEELVFASYDSSTGEWVNLGGVVDTEANIITAKVSHFSPLAAFVYRPIMTPAVFEYSALDISPSQVDIGEAVTISILVANVGDEPGQCVVVLEINGEVGATRNVTLAAGTSKPISFTTIRNTTGTYSVAVSGLLGSFMVKETPGLPIVHAEPLIPGEPIVPPPVTPINWYLIGGVIAALVVTGLTTFFLTKRWAH